MITANLLKPNPMASVLGGRTGTAIMTFEQARALFGESHTEGDGDKVTFGWRFVTPRGPVELRDYWWNAPDELSIAAQNFKASRYLSKYLREHGVAAWSGVFRKYEMPTSA